MNTPDKRVEEIANKYAYEWRYDHEAKAGYLKLSDLPVAQTIVLINGKVFLDKAEDGSVVGVESI